MATILEFSGHQVDPETEKRAAPTEGNTAQIIFFPGVRIERYDIDPFLGDDVEDLQDDRATLSKG